MTEMTPGASARDDHAMTARRFPSKTTPRVAAALAILAGLLNLVSALAPVERHRLRALAAIVPGAVSATSETATAATAVSGLGLLLLAGGLRRRRRSAFLATVVLLLGSGVFHLLKGLDVEEAFIEVFLAGVLVGQSDRFSAHAGPNERPPVLRPAIAVILLTSGFGLLGLALNRHNVTGPLGIWTAFQEVSSLAVGLRGPLGLHGRFGRFFPATMLAVFVAGAVFVIARVLGPTFARRRADPALPALVAASDDSLAYFALRDDRVTVRARDCLIAYGTQGTVALAAGDPLGAREEWPEAVAAFLTEAAAQGRIAAVLGCGADAAAVYEQAGLRALYIGDEAVLDLERFSLDGRTVRIARQSWNRAKRAGFTSEVWRVGELSQDVAEALAALSGRWRGDATERGFSMALGRLCDPRDPGALVVAARDADQRLRGFLHFVPWGRDGASLDVMRRDREGPAILNDFLVVEAALRLPALGVRRVSLNFSFLRGVLAAGAEAGAPWPLRLQRWVLVKLSKPFQIESLYRFNKKFNPSWQPRFVALEAVEDLLWVVMAGLRLEGFVSLPGWWWRAEEPIDDGEPAAQDTPTGAEGA